MLSTVTVLKLTSGLAMTSEVDESLHGQSTCYVEMDGGFPGHVCQLEMPEMLLC